jgi:hypothetical protein
MTINNKFPFALATILILGLLSALCCKKDNNGPPYYMNLTINGVTSSFSKDLKADTFPNPLSISGMNNITKQIFYLRVNYDPNNFSNSPINKITVGARTYESYQIECFLQTARSDTTYSPLGSMTTIDILAINKSIIEGTYEGTLHSPITNRGDSLVIKAEFKLHF